MSNRERAAEIIRQFLNGKEPYSTMLRNRLDNAGLLAPDLPEPNDTDIFVPDGKGWLPGGQHGPSVWTAPGGRVMVQRIEPGDLTPDEARDFAHAVLAAANYSEDTE